MDPVEPITPPLVPPLEVVAPREAASPTAPSGLTAALLAIALGLFDVCLVLPVAIFTGLVIAMTLAVILAVPLDRVGALDGDFKLAVARALTAILMTIVASGGLRVVRAIGRAASPASTWTKPRYFDGPTLTLLTVLVGAFCLLMPLDLLGVYDVDDAVLGGALLTGALALGVLSTALLTMLAWRATKLVWRVSRTRPALAGAFIVAVGVPAMFGLAFLTYEGGSEDPPDSHAEPAALVEDSRLALEELAHGRAPQSFAFAKPARVDATQGDAEVTSFDADDEETRRWNRCFQTLHSPPAPSAVATQIGRIQRYVASEAEAEDLVHDTLLSVCTTERKQPRNDLRSYFSKAITNAVRGHWKVARRCSDEAVEGCDLETADDLVDELQQAARNDAVQQALCHLERVYPNDVGLLRMVYFQDLSAAEIARQTREPAANVRQRLVTARRRLLAAIPQWCRPLGQIGSGE